MKDGQGNGEEFHGIDLDALKHRDRAKKRQDKEARGVDLTVGDYIQLLLKDPKIAQTSKARLCEIVLDAGTRPLASDEKWLYADEEYLLFSEQLFGSNDAIQMLVEYLKAAAAGESLGKQALVLVGPTASGKSTKISILMKALEQYKKRPVYVLKGCPVRHDPLFVLPRYLRKEAALHPEQCPDYPNGCREKGHIHLGIPIQGDLCPKCRDRLLNEFRDEDGGEIRWWDFPVERFTFSVQGTRGIGSFEPSDEKSADMASLVGRENVAITTTKGYDHPEAFSLSGELEKGNRGLTEGREILLVDSEILRVLISLNEEGEIKVQGSNFPHISIDTLLAGHVNLAGYYKFSNNKENEGMHDRIYVVPDPYPVRVRDEVKIYRKLIQTDTEFSDLQRAHIAPGTLELAALFAVMTRLLPSKQGIDALTKAKAYNGDLVLTELRDKDKKPIDLRELMLDGQSNPDIGKREGMFGVSSRDVMAALNTAHAKQSGKNGCLTPMKALRALRDVFDHRMGYSPEDIERFRELLSAGEGGSVVAEFREFVVEQVSKAFLIAYEDLVVGQVRKYLEEARWYRDQKRKFVRGDTFDVRRDDMTGRPKEADMKFLRSVEDHIPIDPSQADVFRGEILEAAGTSLDFDYPPLRKAVEKKLLNDTKASLKAILVTDRPKSDEESRRTRDLFDGLQQQGCCPVCARDFVEKAAEFLSE